MRSWATHLGMPCYSSRPGGFPFFIGWIHLVEDERDRILFETHAVVLRLEKGQEEIRDVLREMNGRVRDTEKAISRMWGIGGAVSFLIMMALGWIGWRR